MSQRRELQFSSEDEVIADIGWLRRSYTQLGNWSLPQAAWHLSYLIEKYLEPPEDPHCKPTPEQAERQAHFFAKARKPRGFDGMTAPPATQPPVTCNDEDINRYIDELRRLKAYSQPTVMMGPVGPAPIAECRNAHLAHAAHHLSFLAPKSPPRRTELRFNNAEEAIADVQMLRRGWEHTLGQWTLPQVCWHLNFAMENGMAPTDPKPDTPEQAAAKPRVQSIFTAGRITGMIQAPERSLPPANASADSIDAFLDTLERFKTFPGPFAPHRLFGKLTDEEMRRLQLMHCAHHLGYLAPRPGA